jgi:hypothetical protein
MSHGPGIIERRVAELFAATTGSNLPFSKQVEIIPRLLSVADIADYAFDLKGRPAMRAQRLSATRAAHRLIARAKETDAKAHKLISQAHRETEAAILYPSGSSVPVLVPFDMRASVVSRGGQDK